MEPKRNYDREMRAILGGLPPGEKPRLLLHACCGPCSSAVLEMLARYFQITLFYYNPNIAPEAEYQKRLGELERLVAEMPLESPVEFLSCEYDGEAFAAIARGLEDAPEGGPRCAKCFRLRLERTARAAAEGKFDFFTTTLTVSPLKNAPLLNAIGQAVGAEYGVRFLPSDFKKRDGYKRSIQLSREYGLYRQDYCGCVYSAAERRHKAEKKEENAHGCTP